MKIFVLILFVIFTSNTFAIYGKDSRVDLKDIKDIKLKEISSAIANQLDKNQLKGWTFKKYWTVITKPLGEQGICEVEDFTEQPTIRPECSAVLVSSKHLLMPGNCITEHYCWNDLFYWVFNYSLKDESEFPGKIKKTNFYQCKQIVKRVYDPSSAISYALIELKEEVKGIKPIKLSANLNIQVEDELIAFGHERGLPLKIARGAKVYDQNKTHFLVNSDITGETKGTAIINARTYELEGILIHGTSNYDFKDERCKRLNHLEDHEAQELALKVAPIKELLDGLKITNSI